MIEKLQAYFGTNFKNVNLNDKLVERLTDYFNGVTGHLDTSKGLLLHGEYGTGKTDFFRAVFCGLTKKFTVPHQREGEELIIERKVGYRIIKTRDIRDMYIADRDSYNTLKGVEYLVIDDLGQEATGLIYGSDINPVDELIDSRYEWREEAIRTGWTVPYTFFTTNLNPHDEFFEKNIGGRIRSRLDSLVGVKNFVPLVGVSLRK